MVGFKPAIIDLWNLARNNFHFLCARFLHLFHRFQQGYEYSSYLCSRTYFKDRNYGRIKEIEGDGNESPHGGRV